MPLQIHFLVVIQDNGIGNNEYKSSNYDGAYICVKPVWVCLEKEENTNQN